MDKEQLQKHYDNLSQIYDDYYLANERSKNGRLKKDRERASKTQSDIIKRFESHLRNNPDLKEFIEPNSSNNYDKAIFWDEFLSPNWFSRDLSEVLRKMNDTLNE